MNNKEKLTKELLLYKENVNDLNTTIAEIEKIYGTYKIKQTDIATVMYAYKLAMGMTISDRSWDTNNWKKSIIPIKKLLNTFSGDIKTTIECLEMLSNNFKKNNFTFWNINTIVKYADKWKMDKGL